MDAGPFPNMTKILEVHPLLFASLAESFASWTLDFELARRDIFMTDNFLPDPHLAAHESLKRRINYALSATRNAPGFFATFTLRTRQTRTVFDTANSMHIAENYLLMNSANSKYSNCTFLMKPSITRSFFGPGN